MHEVYTITEIRWENERTRTLVCDRPLPAEPGQFVMLWLPGVDERPFSIAGADPLSLTVAAVGPFSRALHELKAGDRVWVRGPLGQGFRLQGRRVLLAGGGYGMAPLGFLARTALAAGLNVEVCLGAKSGGELLGERELALRGIPFRVVTEDGSRGVTGRITEITAAAIESRRPDCVYACGPAGMLAALEEQCVRYGLPYQFSWEAVMRCGMGLCGRCETHRPGWLACLDGPVETRL